MLAADVDPDANLGLALGFDDETLDSIVPITKMRKLVEERTGANEENQFYRINPKVDDIPDTYSKEVNGVKLLVLVLWKPAAAVVYARSTSCSAGSSITWCFTEMMW